MFYLAVGTLVLTVLMMIEVWLGCRRIEFLRDLPVPKNAQHLPTLSIIIAARNEVAQLENALRSVMALEYPRREIVVVDDRSEDGTGALLDRMASAHPELKIIHVAELPPGWMGKNHALQRGAEASTGELLLFTDADVHFEPTAVKRAAHHLVVQGWDHLTAPPVLEMPTFLTRVVSALFVVGFSAYMKPWKAADPKSRYFIGVGAFNLMRRSVYEAVGGHEPIRLRPDDDLKLGKGIKLAGFRQAVLWGRSMLSVRWYESLPAMVKGLEKNLFAGTEYRLAIILYGVVAIGLVYLFPVVGLVGGDGMIRGLCAAQLAVVVLLFAESARYGGGPFWSGLLAPLSAVLYINMILNSTLKTLLRGGIEWSGTFYPLAELKKNRC